MGLRMKDLPPNAQAMVDKALEIEAKQNGTWVDPSAPKPPIITYVATFSIAGKLRSISSTNFEVFKKAVEKQQRSFPNMPVTFFERTEPQ